MLGRHPGQRDHLAGGGGGIRRIEEARREPDRAGAHALVEPLRHGIDLGGARRAADILHGADPQRRVADQERRVGGGWGRAELVDEARDRVEAIMFAPAQKVERRRRGALQGERREAHTAIADHDGGDALARLGRHVGPAQQQIVVMGVGIDEARRDHLAPRVDRGSALPVRKRAKRHNPLALDRDVGLPSRCSRAVDHRAALDQQIAPFHPEYLACLGSRPRLTTTVLVLRRPVASPSRRAHLGAPQDEATGRLEGRGASPCSEKTPWGKRRVMLPSDVSKCLRAAGRGQDAACWWPSWFDRLTMRDSELSPHPEPVEG